MNTFTARFDEAIDKQLRRSPSYGIDNWLATGRPTKEHPNKQDRGWWDDNGPGMVDAYTAWRARTGWRIWEPTAGEPAIEMRCAFTLPHNIPILAYIDRVFVLPSGALCVVDIKTGARVPDSTQQLGLYATAVELVAGVRPSYGSFWMARKGEHTPPVPLDIWTPRLLGQIYREVVSGVNAQAFPPHITNMCGTCTVSDFCHVAGGAHAQGVDPLASL